MKRTGAIVLFSVALAVLLAVGVYGEPRFALVIGNGDYTHVARLKNPVNDAHDIAAVLRSDGFSVTLLTNATLSQMDEAILHVGSELSGARDSVGFFYYAGHGVQLNGTNYLIPVNAEIPGAVFLSERAEALQSILDEFGRSGNRLNIFVLDACRDNPFSWSRGMGRGLTVVNRQPSGSIIAYAAGAGQVAEDGTGRNGLYTGELLKYLRSPGTDISDVFRETGGAVSKATGGAQSPATYNQFYGTFYLAGAPSPTIRKAGPTVATAAPAITPSQQSSIPQSATLIATVSPFKVYKVGDIGPGGGIVFYDKGYYSDGWRYLEAAPSDQSIGVQWGEHGTSVIGLGTAIGAGKANTKRIVSIIGSGSFAAKLCSALNLGGYHDWFLPSKDELNLMYRERKVIGGFASDLYWSSSENSSNLVWIQAFGDGDQFTYSKDYYLRVRAVREF